MYMVFAYDQYYPQGGFEDYIGSCESLEEARDLLRQRTDDYYQIVVGDRVIERGKLPY